MRWRALGVTAADIRADQDHERLAHCEDERDLQEAQAAGRRRNPASAAAP